MKKQLISCLLIMFSAICQASDESHINEMRALLEAGVDINESLKICKKEENFTQVAFEQVATYLVSPASGELCRFEITYPDGSKTECLLKEQQRKRVSNEGITNSKRYLDMLEENGQIEYGPNDYPFLKEIMENRNICKITSK